MTFQACARLSTLSSLLIALAIFFHAVALDAMTACDLLFLLLMTLSEMFVLALNTCTTLITCLAHSIALTVLG